MSLVNGLLVLCGALATFIWHLYTKSSKVNTQKTTDQVNTLQSKVDDNNKAISEIEKEGKDEKAKDSTLSSDSDFFNNRK